MDPKCTRLLKELREYIDKASAEDKDSMYPKCIRELDGRILEEVAATAAGGMSETAIRLLKKLETAGKTSKIINQRYAKIYEAHSNTDENKIAEAIREKEISNLESTGREKNSECVQEEEPDMEGSTNEGKTTGFHGVSLPSDCFEKLPEERKTFLLQLNASNFLPKEVEVKVHGKYLEIHAKHDKTIDEHGIISREFTRKFDIPEDVDPETFRALYDCYGVLHVEASCTIDNTEPRDIKVLMDEETRQQHIAETFEDLGKEFEDVIQQYIQEGHEIATFARNLAKQHPSDYIPMEEVITP